MQKPTEFEAEFHEWERQIRERENAERERDADERDTWENKGRDLLGDA